MSDVTVTSTDAGPARIYGYYRWESPVGGVLMALIDGLTWFEARENAARKLECAPQDLTFMRVGSAPLRVPASDA